MHSFVGVRGTTLLHSLKRSTIRNIGARCHLRTLSTAPPLDQGVLDGLKGRSLLRIDDYSPQELQAILALSHRLKALRYENNLPRSLVGKSMATIFQKRSTRTRVSTETGIGLLGGKAIFLSSEDIQLGVNETLLDTAKVLSRYNDVILARVYGHEIVEELKLHSTVPVINALSDLHHPLQILADFMTIQERFGADLSNINLSWVGDGNNVLHDIMLGAPLLGMNCRIATPQGYEPDATVIDETNKSVQQYGTTFEAFNDPLHAVKDASIVFTDTWISMGQEEERNEKLRAFHGYQVTHDMMKQGGANDDWCFMHCLPRHEEEVDDAVFYSDRSLVFGEAENRMYTVMAVTCAMLGLTKL